MPDLTGLRLAWQEVLKGCRQKSSIVEHSVLTARAFSHTCPIKNLDSSWINYIAAFTLQWKKMRCGPVWARLLLGPRAMHLAQRPSSGAHLFRPGVQRAPWLPQRLPPGNSLWQGQMLAPQQISVLRIFPQWSIICTGLHEVWNVFLLNGRESYPLANWFKFEAVIIFSCLLQGWTLSVNFSEFRSAKIQKFL